LIDSAKFFFCPFFSALETSAYLTSKLWDMAAAGVRKLREHFLPSSAGDADEEGDEEGGMGDDGEVALTEEDEAALTRLQELGFTREQCLRCYIDANGDEATAGSLLFEGGLEEDGDEGGYDDA
jgi:hypothetical protein